MEYADTGLVGSLGSQGSPLLTFVVTFVCFRDAIVLLVGVEITICSVCCMFLLAGNILSALVAELELEPTSVISKISSSSDEPPALTSTEFIEF
uniref:Uncharacterized protein n=1 Tax=Glossina palpalis gambiensis TaxID=67801 RepID=A0A1B0ASQ6_9MUSC